MLERRGWTVPSVVVTALGTALFTVALAHHLREVAMIAHLGGPLTAFVIDGMPALVLVGAGYRLRRTELTTDEQWITCRWCISGAILGGVIIGATLAVRVFEGRVISEPLFPLLTAVNAGGVAGATAGYFYARAQADARRARTVTEALGFVNSLIRHDLRNDLAVIQTRAELLASDPGAGGTGASEDAEIILDKTTEATTRIGMTRAVAETLVGNPEFESVDLVTVVTGVVEQLTDALDVEVETDLPDSALVVANDGVRSVVDNLLENAIEHNDAENPRIRVDVETKPETVRLTIADNGPGIPADQRANLFDASREAETGGLVIVGTLVEEFGGSIQVRDNEPRGTVFVVDLPRHTDGLDTQ